MKTTNIGIIYNSLDISLIKKPFKKEKLDKTYKILSQIGKKHHLIFFISKYTQYNNNKFKQAWVYDKKWVKVRNQPIDLIYDKFEFNPKTEQLRKKLEKKHTLINDLAIEKMCKDKWLMYRKFSTVSVPTWQVTTKKQILSTAKKKKWNRFVIKPRFGVGGEGVHIITPKKIPKRIPKDTLLQPFIDSRSNPLLAKANAHDLRIVVINGKIDHAYVREAKTGLRANVALGAEVHHIPNKKIPASVKKEINTLDKKLKQYKPRIYTADFLIDETGKAWLGEMNSQPAMYLYFGKEGKKIQKKFFNTFCKALANLQ